MKKLLTVLIAALMLFALVGCSSTPETPEATGGEETTGIPGVEDGVFTISMECGYAPYNWAQEDDSNGAVPIKGSNQFANGYDVMIAKKICEANGWELEVIQSDWDSLVPSVITGTIDAAIAGQSMTAERSEVVDFAGPYYYASIVIVTKADSELANATSINDFGGKRGTAQIETIWYDQCLPQMKGVEIQTATETAPAMLMALETNTVDFVVTDMPTAMGACVAYPDMVIVDLTGTDGDFQFTEQERTENVNIGISVMKGRTALVDAINAVLSPMTSADFEAIMNEAIAIAPVE